MTRLPAIILAFSVSAAVAQTPPAFEVVSIRPHRGDDGNSSTNVLPGGRVDRGSNVTVRKLIRNAFGVEDFQIFGAPGWIDSESYDIEAKTVGGVEVTRWNIQPLMQSLLESRFRFRYRRETRDVPAPSSFAAYRNRASIPR